MKIIKPNISINTHLISDMSSLLSDEAVISGITAQKQTLENIKAKSLVVKDSKLAHIKLINCDLRNCGLDDVSIANGDMSAIKLPGLSADRVEFKSMRLSGAQIYESRLKNVIFIDCKLDLANFRFTKFKNVLFENCVISEADFGNAEFNNVTFSECELSQADFSGSKATKLDLRSSNIVSIIGVSSLKNAIISPTQLIGIAPQLGLEVGLIVEQD